MKKLLLFFVLVFSMSAQAESGCYHPGIGDIVCSPPGGEIFQTGFIFVCGPGKCLVTGMGEVFCSSEKGGEITVGDYGKIVCAGGCVKADRYYCEVPR